ncbi:MAG: ANTAR domain-containing response regulator [Actinomycetota bacterium]
MTEETMDPLRVLVADGAGEHLAHVTGAVAALGHEVVTTVDLARLGSVTLSEKPDVALVIVAEGSGRALEMIDGIVHEATCPVIAILAVQDPAFIKEAARRGLFAYIVHGEDSDQLQSSIDIVLQRFREYHSLEGAFGRRAVTERAKGILMERHSIDEHLAFVTLRDEARRTQRKIIDVAEAILATHRMLPIREPASPATKGEESRA